ncbi:MAG: hypothetical protein GYA24_23245 [Candidatus Lokiarchaeota archaeon]|nr:hypothetical protein [Candidatus Lokiarchaeota archaeon]
MATKSEIAQHAVFFSLKGVRFPCRDCKGLPSVPLSITTEIDPASADQAGRKTARALIVLTECTNCGNAGIVVFDVRV